MEAGMKLTDLFLDQLKTEAASSRKAVERVPDKRAKWKLLAGGRVVDEPVRYRAVRDVFTHMAHHRGQLTVYLRLNDAAVPSIYGPSADEKTFG
jgi:DinB family